MTWNKQNWFELSWKKTQDAEVEVTWEVPVIFSEDVCIALNNAKIGKNKKIYNFTSDLSFSAKQNKKVLITNTNSEHSIEDILTSLVGRFYQKKFPFTAAAEAYCPSLPLPKMNRSTKEIFSSIDWNHPRVTATQIKFTWHGIDNKRMYNVLNGYIKTFKRYEKKGQVEVCTDALDFDIPKNEQGIGVFSFVNLQGRTIRQLIEGFVLDAYDGKPFPFSDEPNQAVNMMPREEAVKLLMQFKKGKWQLIQWEKTNEESVTVSLKDKNLQSFSYSQIYHFLSWQSENHRENIIVSNKKDAIPIRKRTKNDIKSIELYMNEIYGAFYATPFPFEASVADFDLSHHENNATQTCVFNEAPLFDFNDSYADEMDVISILDESLLNTRHTVSIENYKIELIADEKNNKLKLTHIDSNQLLIDILIDLENTPLSQQKQHILFKNRFTVELSEDVKSIELTSKFAYLEIEDLFLAFFPSAHIQKIDEGLPNTMTSKRPADSYYGQGLYLAKESKRPKSQEVQVLSNRLGSK